MATILVVDDERMIGDLLRSVFSAHGHEVLVATSGLEGLELFRQRKPRFTLLDLQMPGMDGLAVLEQIRRTDPDAGVIMLTGGGTDALEIKARGLGVTDFLRKGLPLEVLVKAMDKAMQRSAKVTEAPSGMEAAGKASPDRPAVESILVVDDERDICKLVSEYLTECGYRVLTANDGSTALSLVESEQPQMVILDIGMPGMSGLEVLRQLRVKQYGGGVLALTGSHQQSQLQEMLDLGAVDVMGKPVDLERLELVVQLGCLLATA